MMSKRKITPQSAPSGFLRTKQRMLEWCLRRRPSVQASPIQVRKCSLPKVPREFPRPVLRVLNSRIEVDVVDIDDDDRGQQDHRVDQDKTLDDRVVEIVDRLDRIAVNAGS